MVKIYNMQSNAFSGKEDGRGEARHQVEKSPEIAYLFEVIFRRPADFQMIFQEG